jgi:hypothetical protein
MHSGIQATFNESGSTGTQGGEQPVTNRDLSRAAWRKSAYSGGTSNCVEVAGNLPAIVAVRDSKDPDGPALTFTDTTWGAFTSTVKSGKYDQRLEVAPRTAPRPRGAVRE